MSNNPPDADPDRDDPEYGDVEYTPTPDIFDTMTADAAAIAAVQEAVDNAADAAYEYASEGFDLPDPIQVEITYVASDGDDDEAIIIEDNSGGLPPGQLHVLAQLGASYSVEDSIGRFGVGASRLAALGAEITYASHRQGHEGQQFTVDVERMKEQEGADAFKSPREHAPDLPEGHTRVTVKRLRDGFRPVVESARRAIDARNDDKSEEAEITEADIEAVADALGRTYQRLLRDGVKIGESTRQPFEITLEYDADNHYEFEVEPPEEVEFSYLPFDGLAPREYTEIAFDKGGDTVSPDSAGVRADIKVGLLTHANDQIAGLSVAVNDRMIVAHDTENDLFSSGYLGAYRPAQGHSRLYIEVNLRGDSEHMPFNSTKTGLNPNHEVFDPLLNRVASVAAPYKRQSYTALPDWMLEVYGLEDSRSDGQRESLIRIPKRDSKTNSARFNEKPGQSVRGRRTRDYPERDRLKGIVKTHRALRIRDETLLREYEGPAYRNFFDNHYFTSSAGDYLRRQSEYAPRTLEELSGPLLDDWVEFASVNDDEHPLVVDIKIVAKFGLEHIDGRLDKSGLLEEWAVPRYREEVRILTSGSLEGVAVWDDPTKIPMEEFTGVTVTFRENEIPFPDRSPIFDREAMQTALESRDLLPEATDSETETSSETTSEAESTETTTAEATDEASADGHTDDGAVEQQTLTSQDSPDDHSGVFKSTKESSASASTESDATQQTATDGAAIIIGGDRYVVDDDDFERVVDLVGLDDDPAPKDLVEAILMELEEGQEAKARLEEFRDRIGPILDQ
ncbi:ATP-binding protein [Haloarcula sp. 1CSR25-25]|uniref:ATP-binding protein n=1 Tax=Haloarcula sp. 1CSR25-25 TaxID=2862545 RepID=UPI002894A0CA|nr:ATP-binding protein [Haloarcula sp. 1CSR25-25]MDT3434674.1 ATP-binding protein [Haloarcula sp. 1CSR25-25]